MVGVPPTILVPAFFTPQVHLEVEVAASINTYINIRVGLSTLSVSPFLALLYSIGSRSNTQTNSKPERGFEGILFFLALPKKQLSFTVPPAVESLS